MMREKVIMTYWKYTNKKGYMGHWKLNYYVSNVCLLKDNSLICDEYVFEGSKIFKGKKLKNGDKVIMTVTITNEKGKISLKNYSDVIKVSSE